MKYFYLLLLSIIPAAVFSQTNFQKGYIIKTTGDTVSGYIDNREWNRNPDVINFKPTQTAKEATYYKPENIKAFVISGVNEYQSYSGYISMGKTQGTQLSSGIDTTTLKVYVFLKVLADGTNVKLYAYTDKIKPRYFVQEKGGQPNELKYNAFYSNTTDDNGIVNTEIYKGQLSLLAKKYAPDNASLTKLIARADYHAVQLTTIVNKINNKGIASDAKSSYDNHFRLFVGAGIRRTTSKFKAGGDFATANSSSSTAPVFEAGIDFLPRPHSQKFILRAALTYSWANSSFEADHVVLVDKYTASIKQRTFTVLPQVIYNFYNSENIKIYAGVGVGINLSTYKTTESTTINAYTVNYNNLFKFDSDWINIPLEAGVVVNKRLDIMARYVLPSEYVSGDDHVRVTSFGVGAHWLLGKKY
jgi:outer membrane protein W